MGVSVLTSRSSLVEVRRSAGGGASKPPHRNAVVATARACGWFRGPRPVGAWNHPAQSAPSACSSQEAASTPPALRRTSINEASARLHPQGAHRGSTVPPEPSGPGTPGGLARTADRVEGEGICAVRLRAARPSARKASRRRLSTLRHAIIGARTGLSIKTPGPSTASSTITTRVCTASGSSVIVTLASPIGQPLARRSSRWPGTLSTTSVSSFSTTATRRSSGAAPTPAPARHRRPRHRVAPTTQSG